MPARVRSRTANKPALDRPFEQALEDYQRQRALTTSEGREASQSRVGASDVSELAFGGIPKAVQEMDIRTLLQPHCTVLSVEIGSKSGIRTGNVYIAVQGYRDSPSSRATITQSALNRGINKFIFTACKGRENVAPDVSRKQREYDSLIEKTAQNMQEVPPSKQATAPIFPDLVPLIDLEDDLACQAPVLPFSSVASPPSPPGLSDELAALRKAFVDLEDPRMLGQVEVILGILLMLPKKQRLKCLLSSAYLAVKAQAALHLLQAEPL